MSNVLSVSEHEQWSYYEVQCQYIWRTNVPAHTFPKVHGYNLLESLISLCADAKDGRTGSRNKLRFFGDAKGDCIAIHFTG